MFDTSTCLQFAFTHSHSIDSCHFGSSLIGELEFTVVFCVFFADFITKTPFSASITSTMSDTIHFTFHQSFITEQCKNYKKGTIFQHQDMTGDYYLCN